MTEQDQNEPERWDPDEPELSQLDDEPPSAFHRERRSTAAHRSGYLTTSWLSSPRRSGWRRG